jgi:hypothetical protein
MAAESRIPNEIEIEDIATRELEDEWDQPIALALEQIAAADGQLDSEQAAQRGARSRRNTYFRSAPRIARS